MRILRNRFYKFPAAGLPLLFLLAIASVSIGADNLDMEPSVLPQSPSTRPTTAEKSSLADHGIGGQLPEDSPELMLFKDIPIVVAAGKREQTEAQVAASVSLITADDIETFGYRSLADVLRAQRGFYTFTDGLNSFAGVRGFLRPGEWNGRILVLVDGTPTREPVYGQTNLDLDFVVPLELAQRVEVIRGPGSALYGSGAVFGVINVVTKNGADIDGLQVKVTGGTDDTARIVGLFGTQTRNGWDIVVGGSGYTSQGDNDIIYDGVQDAAHNFGHIRGADYEGTESAFMKVRKGEFMLQADFESRLKDNRAATYFDSFFNPGSMREQRANITARIDHEIASGQSFHASVHYGHYIYDQTFNYDSAAPTPAYSYRSRENSDWVNEELHYDWQITPKLHLLAGADATESLFTRQFDTDTLTGPVNDIPASYNQAALFAEGEYKVTDWLTLIGGGRADDVQRIGWEASPRLAAIWNPDKQDTIKALYGRAFRAPNLYELLYTVPGQDAGNLNLHPEIVDTYELIWERQFDPSLQTSLNGFVWKMKDPIKNVSLPDGALQSQNGPALWAHGVEAEIQKRWEGGAQIRAFGSYTRAEHDGNGVNYSPEWIVGTSSSIPVFSRHTTLAVEPVVVGPMKSDLGQFTHPTFVTNVFLTSKDLIPNWTVQVGVYNLFADNARFPRGGPYFQSEPTLDYPGTRYMLSLSHKF